MENSIKKITSPLIITPAHWAVAVLSLVIGIFTEPLYAQIPDGLVMPELVLQQTEPAAPADPGWQQGSAEPVSIEDARQILGEPDAKQLKAASLSPQMQSQAAVATPSDYSQLAEALENDPRRIYQYVRNNFEYVPYFGLLKGPYLTLHERSGNDFDQAALLIELLRAAGYTANFRYGEATILTTNPAALPAAAQWLGTQPSLSLIGTSFVQGGVPVTSISNGIKFNHVWVEVTIDGSVVSLDPSYKLSTAYSPINLDTAMGFNQSSLLTAAGGTLGANSIQNMSASGVNNYLAARTTQLQTYLKQNYPNAYVEEVIGGYKIIPDNSTTLPATLPLSATPSFAAWATVPATYIHTVHLQHGGISKTYNIPNIAGRKLSISYTGDNVVIDPPPPSAQDFGSVAIGEVGPTLQATQSNTGNVVFQMTATLSGSNAFSITSGAGTQNVPIGGSATVKYRFSGVGQTAGRKNAVLTLTLTYMGVVFNSSAVNLTGVVEADRLAEIYIDDVLDVAEVSPTGNLNNLVVTVNHPYAAISGSYADQTTTFTLDRSGSYVLASGFGGDKHSTLLSERQRLLDRMSVEGKAADSREVMSETLNIIGQTWLQQTQLNGDILAAISSERHIWHHRFGIAGQGKSYYVDVQAQYVSSPARVTTPKTGSFQARSYIASAMEHSVLEQLQGASNPAISTIKIFALNNQNGGKLFLANSSNFAAIQGQLSNYTPAALSNLQSAVNAGHTLILPANGAVTLNDWSGEGYVDYYTSGGTRGIGMFIGGGLNGGFASLTQQLSYQVTQNNFIPTLMPKANILNKPKSKDPVDLGTGAFLSEMTDLTLGSDGPRGLGFSRSYNSQQVSRDVAGLGRGWNHNYNIYLSIHSDVESALGEDTLFETLPMLVAAHVTRSLMEPTQPSLQQWAVASLVANWTTDQLLNKSVTVHIGSEALTYKELPDGSFAAPAGVTTKLVRLGDNTFELRERFGTVLKFNNANKIQSLTDIDGNALSFTYASGKLTQVADTYGRTLTLGYTGDQLSSVTDSTGRSVSYSHTGATLTGVTGLESANWQYSYDSLYRMRTVTDPLGTLIVDNTYNNFDRVVQQLAPRETGTALYKMHYTGLSSSEENPDGTRTTYYYDFDGRAIGIEDAAGNKAETRYDGQGHIIATVDAKGRQTNLTYDDDHNLTKRRNPLNQEVTLAYDAQHRLISTTDPLSHSSEVDYDTEHHPVAARDALNNQATTAYLGNGLVTSATDPRSTVSQFTYNSYGQPATSKTGSHPVLTTVYNTRGLLQSQTDQVGAQTQFAYDDRGLVETRTDALTKTTTSLYNTLGLPTSQTDRNGNTVTTSYTATSKLNTLTFPARSTPTGNAPAFTMGRNRGRRE